MIPLCSENFQTKNIVSKKLFKSIFFSQDSFKKDYEIL
jgi:hypothetical protein